VRKTPIVRIATNRQLATMVTLRTISLAGHAALPRPGARRNSPMALFNCCIEAITIALR
jgi:hypothetical protein